MIDLLIIADDFTGALDTAAQFRKKGAVTYVVTDVNINYDCLGPDIQVLALDAETRHLSPEEAYQVVLQVVRKALECKVKYIYKKTDSALRGNIGAELAALADATGRTVNFIPSYPKMGRITKANIHYIDGIPVGESIFSRDLFEPVTESSVTEVIKMQTDKKVCYTDKINNINDMFQNDIIVYGSERQTQLYDIGKYLLKIGRLNICAGCAGFGEVLAELLGYRVCQSESPKLSDKLLVVCGSINPITTEQLFTAQQSGIPRIQLSPEQKLDEKWSQTVNGQFMISKWKRIIMENGSCIIDSSNSKDKALEKQYIDRHGYQISDLQRLISDSLGMITKALIDQEINAVMLITGGDTLMGFMKKINVSILKPICELFPGVILSCLLYQDREYYVISKSGGFGEKTVIMEINNILKKRGKRYADTI